MRKFTDHTSFILKPSQAVPGGVGVFALHDIAEGVHVAVFAEGFQEEIRDLEDVPEELQGYCLDQPGDKLLCPKLFNRMDVGNYLNHSSERANLRYEKEKGYYAKRDIRKGEELLADYRELDEPEEAWEDYYTARN